MNGFTGTLADDLEVHNRQQFTTFDSDNDNHSTQNCASSHFGGRWFNFCFLFHLNGKYYSGGKMAIDKDSKYILTNTGIRWHTNGFTEMKLRKNYNYHTLYFCKLTREHAISQYPVGKYLL